MAGEHVQRLEAVAGDDQPGLATEPVGDRIVLHKYTGDCDAPADVGALTDRTVALMERRASEIPGAVTLGEGEVLPDDLASGLLRNKMALAVATRDVHSAIEYRRDVRVEFRYFGDPVACPGLERAYQEWSMSTRSIQQHSTVLACMSTWWIGETTHQKN